MGFYLCQQWGVPGVYKYWRERRVSILETECPGDLEVHPLFTNIPISEFQDAFCRPREPGL